MEMLRHRPELAAPQQQGDAERVHWEYWLLFWTSYEMDTDK